MLSLCNVLDANNITLLVNYYDSLIKFLYYTQNLKLIVILNYLGQKVSLLVHTVLG